MDRMKLLVSIVERGHGVAMQRLYSKYQLFLHLQCAGRGTATSEIMDILGLGSTEKDVVLSFASQAPAAALDAARPSSQAVKSAASRRYFSMVAGLFSSHTRRCLNAWSCSPVMV